MTYALLVVLKGRVGRKRNQENILELNSCKEDLAYLYAVTRCQMNISP